MLVTNERWIVILGPAPDRELQRVLGELDWSVAEKERIVTFFAFNCNLKGILWMIVRGAVSIGMKIQLCIVG